MADPMISRSAASAGRALIDISHSLLYSRQKATVA